jgi:hypothetical protein
LLLVGGAHFEKTVSVKTLLKRSRHDWSSEGGPQRASPSEPSVFAEVT